MRKSVFKSYSMVIEMDLIRNCSIGKYDALARVRCMVFRKQHENWLMCPLFCIKPSKHQSIKELILLRILKMHQDINLTIKASSQVWNARMLLTSSALGICRTFALEDPLKEMRRSYFCQCFFPHIGKYIVSRHTFLNYCTWDVTSSIWLMRPFVLHLLGITASHKGIKSGLFETWGDTSAPGICRTSPQRNAQICWSSFCQLAMCRKSFHWNLHCIEARVLELRWVGCYKKHVNGINIVNKSSPTLVAPCVWYFIRPFLPLVMLQETTEKIPDINLVCPNFE